MSDWYKDCLTDKMEKEATFKEGVMISMISFLSGTAAWFEGGALMEYLQEKNVPQEMFAETINSINDTNKSIQEIDKGDIILAKENYEEKLQVQQKTEIEVEKETRENLTPLETIARTIYDEARGEDYEGMKAVADTILNRSNGSPESMKDICIKPFQFSGWNNNNMLNQGSGRKWEISKQLAQYILSPQTTPQKNGYKYFCNPRMILKQKGVNINPIETNEDITKIPEGALKYLPSFMFNSVRVNLGRGKWKNSYPKISQNLRKDFAIVGNHVFYQ